LEIKAYAWYQACAASEVKEYHKVKIKEGNGRTYKLEQLKYYWDSLWPLHR
jgi:hypothetical protein